MDTETSDETLMTSYRHGDAAAFETLYQRHKGPLYRYLKRQCPANVVDELFQDVWMKIIHSRERYEVRARFRTFLYHLAHNRLIDYYRAQNGRVPGRHGEANPGDVAELPAGDTEQPERRVQGQQQMQRLLALLDDLPVQQREAFLLKEEAGLSVAEIAEVMDVGAETAKSRLRYALQRLREGLKEWL